MTSGGGTNSIRSVGGQLGTLALSTGLGAAGGAFFGPIGAYAGQVAGQLLGGFLFGEGEPDVINEGPRLTDLKVTTSSFGRPIPWTFGSVRTGTTMFWALDLIETRHESSRQEGGKGGGGHTVTDITYTYALKAAFSVNRGTRKILQIFTDSKLLVDRSAETGAVVGNKHLDALRFYDGSETQLPDPLLVEELGADSTSAFRGISYFVCDNFQLEDFSNRVPQFTVVSAQDPTQINPVASVDLVTTEDVTAISEGVRGGRFWYDGTGRKWDMPTQSLFYTNGEVPQVADSSALIGYAFDIGSVHEVIRIDLDTGERINAIDDTDDPGLAGYVFEDLTLVLDPAPNPSTGPLNRIVVVDDDTDSLTIIKVYTEAISAENLALFQAGSISAKAAPEFIAILSGADKNIGLGLNTHPDLPTDFSTNGPPGIITDSAGDCWIIAEMVGTGLSGTPNIGLWQFKPWSLIWGIFREYAGGLGSTGLGKLGYDSLSNALVWKASDGTLRVYDIDDDAVTVTTLAGWDDDNNANIKSGSSPNGFFWMRTGDTMAKFDMVAREFAITDTVDQWLDTGSPTEGFMYDPSSDAGIMIHDDGGTYEWLHLNRSSTDNSGVTLESIIQDIAAEVSVPASELITTDLSGVIVKGFAVTNRMSARAAMEALRLAYEFDGAEIDYKINFQRRSTAVSFRTLTQKDVGFNDSYFVRDLRKHEYNLPQKVEVTYSDIDADFQTGIQQHKRGDIVTVTRDQLKVDVAAVMDGPEARDLAENILFRLWIEIDSKELTVSNQNIDLAPMDVITLVLDDGSSFNMYLDDVSVGEDLTVELLGPIQDPELATGSGVVAEISNVPTQILVNPGVPVVEIFDTSILQDADGDGLHLYTSVTVAGNQANFGGAITQRSFDSASWTDFHVTPTPEVGAIGLMIDQGGLNDFTRYATWDRTSRPLIRMISGSLTSTTEDLVLDGANAMLIGDEIIQFANATLIAPKVYELSDLLRGRRGTDYAAAVIHVGTQRAVLLTEIGVGLAAYESAALSRLNYFRTVDFLQSEISKTTLVPVGRTLKPYGPVIIEGTVSGSGVAVTWHRRTRIGHAFDFQLGPSEAPLSEVFEQYELDILDLGGSVVRNTLTGMTSESKTIAASDLDVAFGTSFDPSDAFDVILYQMSEAIGRGYPSRQTTMPNVGVLVTHPGAT